MINVKLDKVLWMLREDDSWWSSTSSFQVSMTQVWHWLSVGNAIRVSWENTFAKSMADNVDTADVDAIVIAVWWVDTYTYMLLWARITTAAAVPNEVAWTLLYLSDATAWLLTATVPTTVWSVIKPVARVSVADTEMITFNLRWEVIT